MQLDVADIPSSRRDKESNIRLPEVLTPKLAEFLGIMVGDGHVGAHKRRKQNGFYYDINICGHIKDKYYHLQYVNELAQTLLGVKFNVQVIKRRNVIVLRKQSQAICHFLKDLFGLPHKKQFVTVPDRILNGDFRIKSAFLRGLADSDFCFVIKYKPKAYPVVQGDSISEKLMQQCSQMLCELGIQNYVRKEVDYYAKRCKTYVRYRIYVNGYARVKTFMDEVGFQNPNKIKKYKQFLRKTNCL